MQLKSPEQRWKTEYKDLNKGNQTASARQRAGEKERLSAISFRMRIVNMAKAC